MHKLLYFLILGILIHDSFAQEMPAKKLVSRTAIDLFYYGGNVYRDTIEIQYAVRDTTKNKLFPRISFANGSVRNGLSADSIPDNALIRINDVSFRNKEVLKWISDVKVLSLRNDSLFYAGLKNPDIELMKLPKPRIQALLIQKHSRLPKDFFFFTPYELQGIRFRCFAESPIYDLLDFHQETGKSLARYVIDGKLQPLNVTFESLNKAEIKKIEVYSPLEAQRFFGNSFRNGLVEVVTRNGHSRNDLHLRNIRILEEMQVKNGKWQLLKDTVMTFEEVIAYRNERLTANGAPVYMIDGENETEYVNRKTIDIGSIEKIDIKRAENRFDNISQTFSKIGNDTIFLNIRRYHANNRLSNFASIMSDLQRLRQDNTESVPIYIVDEVEIDVEKLKHFKSKELEMIAVLQGCEAIQKYGKRGENGVVIYKTRK